ncbi:MAG: lipoprotein-releasing ABC transporter permease subunit [Alphaproteobacteria bacterium]
MMFSRAEWMVAGRYMRARRQEGFISVIALFSLLGIALGVATLIIVLSVMNGFRTELLGRIIGLNGHFSVMGVQGPLNNYDDLLADLQQLDAVVSVTPLVEGQVLASNGGRAAGAMIRGVRPEDLMARTIVAEGTSEGALEAFVGDDAVILGSVLARNLGISPGDQITLLSPQGMTTIFGTVPRMRAYTVVGTFNVGMFEYDSSFVFMPIEAAQVYFQLPQSVSQLEVMIDHADRVAEVRPELDAALGLRARLFDWQQANSSFFNALQVERNVMFMILTLIILIAAFNIISSLIMLVKDKGSDIAILRTMGASRGMVMRIFFIAGASIGVLGTIAGTILGLAFAANIESIRQFLQGLTGTELFAAEIYFLSQLPAEVDPREVVTVILMALGLSLLATIYPSWRAARLDPVEALRYG